MASNPHNVGTGGEIMDVASTTIKLPFVRSPYNYDLVQASTDTAVHPGGPSLTVQSQAEDADINVMMKRFGVTGQFPINPKTPLYGDFSDVTDFASALNAVQAAEHAFLEYPADFRARFENNPQLFLEFCENPANRDEIKKLGLAAADAQFAKDNPHFAAEGKPLPSAVAAAAAVPSSPEVK